MVGVCSPLDAHQNLFGVFIDMPRATVNPFPALPQGFWGCTSQLSVGFHDVLSLHCLGWSWEHMDRVTADNNHADSADGSWEEGSDHIPIAPSTGKAAIRSPLAMLQAATMLESVRSHGGDTLLFLLFSFSLLPSFWQSPFLRTVHSLRRCSLMSGSWTSVQMFHT